MDRLRTMWPVAVAVALAAVQSAPPVQGAEWTRRTPLPEARTEVSVTTDGERIYAVGGFGPGRTAPRTMYAYEPESDRWSSLGSIPQGVNHAGLVALDGKLYIVGGYREATFSPTDAVHVYDLAEGGWGRGTPLPTPRGAMAVAVVDGKIHAIGGTADGRRSVGTHEVYNPDKGRWVSKAPLPTPRNHMGAAVVDGRIHVPGGRAGGDFTLTVHEIYDPVTDTWRDGAPLPTGRSGIAVVAHRGEVYVFGGEVFGAAGRTFNDAERYDPATDGWAMLPPMPTARHGLGAASFGSAIYVIAGGPSPGGSFSAANERLVP